MLVEQATRGVEDLITSVGEAARDRRLCSGGSVPTQGCWRESLFTRNSASLARVASSHASRASDSVVPRSRASRDHIIGCGICAS